MKEVVTKETLAYSETVLERVTHQVGGLRSEFGYQGKNTDIIQLAYDSALLRSCVPSIKEGRCSCPFLAVSDTIGCSL